MSETTHFSKSTLTFLRKLAKNNNRDWFTANKDAYDAAWKELKQFSQTLEERLSEHDVLQRIKIFRIYRDVRFSKDKTPYKEHFSMNPIRDGAHRRGGYYFMLKPGESMGGGGFYQPEKEDLLRIRKEFEMSDQPIRKIIGSKTFKETFGELLGDKVKTSPKGFDKTHPAIDLIRHKSFYVMHPFTDQEVTTPGFVDQVNDLYVKLRPFFDYMSEVLTTDLNGVSILED